MLASGAIAQPGAPAPAPVARTSEVGRTQLGGTERKENGGGGRESNPPDEDHSSQPL